MLSTLDVVGQIEQKTTVPTSPTPRRTILTDLKNMWGCMTRKLPTALSLPGLRVTI